LWYTIHHQPHAPGYLKAIMCSIVSAAKGIRVDGAPEAIERATPEGSALMGTIAQEWVAV